MKQNWYFILVILIVLFSCKKEEEKPQSIDKAQLNGIWELLESREEYFDVNHKLFGSSESINILKIYNLEITNDSLKYHRKPNPNPSVPQIPIYGPRSISYSLSFEGNKNYIVTKKPLHAWPNEKQEISKLEKDFLELKYQSVGNKFWFIDKNGVTREAAFHYSIRSFSK